MKNILYVLALLMIVSCKKQPQSDSDYVDEKPEIAHTIPGNITKILDAHGGLEQWNKMERLSFNIEKEAGEEKTITDLKSRKSLIKTEAFSLGFDGEEVWLKDTDSLYKGNPKFYYNLMFYFYAMPFVLADNGIKYENVAPLVFNDKSYPGIKISYEDGVGASPEDEYILYYNPETYQMEWLAYTVTFFSKEKSKKFRYINYSNWQEINGLKLPETLTWYKVEEKKPTVERNAVKFIKVDVSDKKESDAIFNKPETAKIVE